VEDVLLSVHVLAAIVFVGGSAIAASLFPRYAPIVIPTDVGNASTQQGSVSVRQGSVSAQQGSIHRHHGNVSTTPVSVSPNAAVDSPLKSQGVRNRAVAVALHRITKGYGTFGIVVPLAGIALALAQGRMGEIWISVALILTTLAGGLLALLIHPRQREALAHPDNGARLRRLSMLAGIYNLVWAVVVVLMIVRPGADG
jgi:zinc transporter ZupT